MAINVARKARTMTTAREITLGTRVCVYTQGGQVLTGLAPLGLTLGIYIDEDPEAYHAAAIRELDRKGAVWIDDDTLIVVSEHQGALDFIGGVKW